MKFIITCFAILALSRLASAEDITVKSVVSGCKSLTGDSSLEGAYDVGLCHGVVISIFHHLKTIHEYYYEPRFGSINEPFRDQAVIQAYIAANFAFGPNVCFPPSISVNDLASAVERYGRSNPDKMTGLVYPFVMDAFRASYGCKANQHN